MVAELAPIRPESARAPAPMVALALPLFASSLASTGLGVFNALQVAPLGADALAAVGFGAMLTSLVQAVGLGLFAGGRIALAQAVGAGDQPRARALGRTMIVLALALGAGALALVPLVDPLLAPLGVPVAAASGAHDYLVVRLLGAPLLFLLDAAVHVLQGPGRPQDLRRATHAMIATALATIVLTPAFTSALELGVTGAAWSANAGITIGLAVAAPRTLVHLRGRPTRGRGLLRPLRTIAALGLPLTGVNVADVASHLALQSLMAHVGEVELAAHVLALRLTGLACLPAYAIGDALSLVVGRVAGARRGDLVRPFARTALRLAVGVVALASLTFATASDALASVSGATPDVAAIASRLIVLGAVVQLAEGAVAVGLGALAGLGQTRFLLVATLASAWLVKLPAAAVLSHLGLGIDAAWWAAGLELAVLGALTAYRLVPRLRARAHTSDAPMLASTPVGAA